MDFDILRRDYWRRDLRGGLQKLVDDFISASRDSAGPLKTRLRRFLDDHLHPHPARRMPRIAALREKGDLDSYYPALRDAAIEFARLGLGGEAVRIDAILPDQYKTPHFNRVVRKMLGGDGDNFEFLNIEVSTACNIRCALCFHGRNANSYHSLNQLMPLDRFKIIWDKMKGRTQRLFLQGWGESFMNPDIYDMIEYCAPTPVYLDTNGNLPLNADRLVKCENFEQLTFSIDGIDQRTYEQYRVGGSFDKAVANLSRVIAAKQKAGAKNPHIVFKFVTFKHNEMYVEPARQLARRLGADEFKQTFCHVNETTPDFRRAIMDFIPLGYPEMAGIKGFDLSQRMMVPSDDAGSPFCRIPSMAPIVKIDGTVAYCVGTQIHNPELDLLKRDFDSIWNDPAYRQYRLEAIGDKNAREECRACQSWQKPSFRQAFEGTPAPYPPDIEFSDDILYLKDLTLEPDYVRQLRARGLTDELRYFEKLGKL